MLKHKRLVSLIATIAFCLSFLAPALLAPAPAVAASSYTVLSAPTIPIGAGPYTGQLGKVAIDIPEIAALAPGDTFTITLPSGVECGSAGKTSVAANAYDVQIDDLVLLNRYADDPTKPELGPNALEVIRASARVIDVRWTGGANRTYGPARIVVDFRNIKVAGVSGDIEVTFSAAPNTAWSSGKVVIAKTTSTGMAYASIGSVKTMSSSGGAIDTITLAETLPGTFKANMEITLTLPNGFEWTVDNTIDPKPADIAVVGGWGLGADDAKFSASIDGKDKRKLSVKFPDTWKQSPRTDKGLSGAGRVSIVYAAIDVDDSVAKVGDIVVDLSSRDLDIVPGTLTVGKYADFGVIFEEDNPKEVISGVREIEVGNIVIKETAANSLVANRDLRFELPSGVKWASNDAGNGILYPIRTLIEGDPITWKDFTAVGTDRRVIKLAVEKGTTTNAATYKLTKVKLDISPTFSGDVICKITGSQGVTGEVKLATVQPRITVKTDGEPSKVNIGAQNQALPDILIVETVKEAIRSLDYDTKNSTELKVVLPPAVVFTTLPTVEVTDGDLVIDKQGITKSSTDGAIYRGVLTIPIKGSSTKPSTIKLSNVKVTVDRTVAEGPLTVAVTSVPKYDALDECAINGNRFFTYEAVAATKAAECVTPSASEGRSAVFYIGSTIYNVNGVNKIMDVAPYIKAGRTYVPVRYLGEALGADVAWDEVTKTVTLTKGDKSVVLVIGSTIAKVNGADVQMDVAPEIVNGRTMLPARRVAEGLGYMVGWNEVLKQVVVQEQL